MTKMEKTIQIHQKYVSGPCPLNLCILGMLSPGLNVTVPVAQQSMFAMLTILVSTIPCVDMHYTRGTSSGHTVQRSLI